MRFEIDFISGRVATTEAGMDVEQACAAIEKATDIDELSRARLYRGLSLACAARISDRHKVAMRALESSTSTK